MGQDLQVSKKNCNFAEKSMRQLILYIVFLVSMVFTGYGEMSAMSHTHAIQDSYSIEKTGKKDGLAKVDHKPLKQDAQLEDSSTVAYRVCTNRPQRLSPSGNMHAHSSTSRLLYHKIPLLLHFTSFCGMEHLRQETAPIHFDVASKYYVICLRHLLC